jgi:hypothetical protein
MGKNLFCLLMFRLLIFVRMLLFIGIFLLTMYSIYLIHLARVGGASEKWESCMSLPYISVICIIFYCIALLFPFKNKFYYRVVVMLFVLLLPIWLFLIVFAREIFELSIAV